MKEFLTNPFYLCLLVLLVLNFALGALNRRAIPLPILSVAGRWIRFTFFSLAIVILLKDVLPDRSLGVILLISAIIFILVETFFYWIQISLFNGLSNINRYAECDSAWRPERELLELKNKLEKDGFKKIGSFKSSVEDVDLVFSTVFENSNSESRLVVSFIPYGDIWRCATFIESILEDKSVVYTEAAQIPFGLEYPPEYKVRRFPMVSNPLKLVALHEDRLKSFNSKPAAFTTNAAEFLNGQNFEVEKFNRSLGLINQAGDFEFDGYLTTDGKYRVWEEMIKLNYFPFLVK